MYKLEKSITNTHHYKYNTKTDNIVHIGYGIDNNYARCTGTSIASICLNNKNINFSFHIVAYKFDISTKEKFKLLAKKYSIDINIYEIDITYLKNLPTKKNLPLSMYFRLILPIILPKIKQIIYLDADVICLNNINKLFYCNLKKSIIAAVSDLEQINIERIQSLKLKNHIYFNSGVLLINIDKWNKYNISEKILKLLNINIGNKNILFPDQDALNIVLTQNVTYLPKEYNCIDFNNIEKKHIVFLHFTANPKPWHLAWSVNKQCNKFNANLYQKYEQQTPWSNMPLIKPQTYKEMEYYAKDLRKKNFFLKSLKWYLKYLHKKILK